MQRTQLMLDKETKAELKKIAKAEGKSMAQLVRGMVKEGVKRKRKKDLGSVLLEMAAKGKATGHPDLSSNIDEYLYGSKRIK